MSQLKKNATVILKLLLAVTLFYILFDRVDLREVIRTFSHGNYGYLFLSLGSFILAFFCFFSYRFHVLVRDITRSFYKSFKLTAIGFFFNNFLPTNVGGDGIKLYLLKKEKQENTWEKGLSYILTERFVGFAVIFITWIIYTLFYWNIYFKAYQQIVEKITIDRQKLLIISGLIFLLIIGIILFFVFRRKNWMTDLKKRIINLKNHLLNVAPHKFLTVVFYSVLFHLMRGVGFYFLLVYFNATIEPVHIIFLLFMSTFIGFLPISIGALGTLETAIVLSLLTFGINEEIALAMAIFFRLFLIFFSAIGGLFYLSSRNDNKYLRTKTQNNP